MNCTSSKICSLLKQRSVQTLLVLTIYALTAQFLPLEVHEGFYTLSLFIKDTLIWVLPMTVGFFIASTLASFERRAPLFILALVLFEAMSNFSSVWYAYFSATAIADHLPIFGSSMLESNFHALWRLPFTKPTWWSADKGSFAGLALGIIAAFSKGEALKQFIKKGKFIFEWTLTRVFARLIPLFVLGFAANMYQTELLGHVISHYATLVGWLVMFLAAYILFLFVLGAGLSFSRVVSNIKNLLPAWGISLTSGCSLSTMPWTIEGASKNMKDPDLAKAIIPATTNIQQVGDCITNAFLCFLIYSNFYGHAPDILLWLQFSVVFVLARFATAAILGGAIFIMLPIYENYLNFTGEMIAIILALNVVLDPLVTSSNVITNGALARVFEKFFTAILKGLGKKPLNVSTKIFNKARAR